VGPIRTLENAEVIRQLLRSALLAAGCRVRDPRQESECAADPFEVSRRLNLSVGTVEYLQFGSRVALRDLPFSLVEQRSGGMWRVHRVAS
jgi:hypothetical protein